MSTETKYARVEYERRFLIRAGTDWQTQAEATADRIEDKYLCGTRLRLRVVTNTRSQHRLVKLTKKEDSPSPYFRTISRILLSNEEHRVFDSLDGDRLTKTRHRVALDGVGFAIDVFDAPLDGLLLCEVEAPSLDELMQVQTPSFAQREVTEDPFFSGANLCRIGRDDLLAKLASLGAS